MAEESSSHQQQPEMDITEFHLPELLAGSSETESQLSKNEILRLIHIKDPQIRLQKNYENSGMHWKVFQLVYNNSKRLNWVYCMECKNLLSFNSRHGTSHLKRHGCTKACSESVIGGEKNYEISDYLETRDKQTNRGKCKGCDKEILWNRKKLSSHKRSACPGATEDEKELFAKDPSSNETVGRMTYTTNFTNSDDGVEDTRKFQIADYLDNRDKVTNRGKCKACDKMVLWNREKVSSHKRSACFNIGAEERILFAKSSVEMEDESECSNEEPIEDEIKTFAITQYLNDYVTKTGAGDCKGCGKAVQWKRAKVAAHKRSTCPNSTVEEKEFFAKRPNKGTSSKKKEIQRPLLVIKPKTETKKCSSCFICKDIIGIGHNRLTNNLDYTRTPLFVILGKIRRNFKSASPLIRFSF